VHIIHPAIPARDIAVANNSESGNNGGAQAAFPLMGGQSSGKGRGPGDPHSAGLTVKASLTLPGDNFYAPASQSEVLASVLGCIRFAPDRLDWSLVLGWVKIRSSNGFLLLDAGTQRG
jgi:hypothetical protein